MNKTNSKNTSDEYKYILKTLNNKSLLFTFFYTVIYIYFLKCYEINPIFFKCGPLLLTPTKDPSFLQMKKYSKSSSSL